MSKKVIFRLIGNVTPVSWELPLRNVYLPRKNKEGNGSADKLIAYRKGAPSIWDEDYKGDKKPIPAVYFENGTLEVEPTDVLLLEILEKHRFANKRYERYDPDTTAEKKLEAFHLREKALELVNVSGETRVKAMALALLGQETISFTVTQALAELKQKAYDNPKALIDTYDEPDYEAKYVVALAYLKGIIKDNESQTSVIWADSGNPIIRLAVGEDGITQMSKFLAVKSEESVITMQRIGTLVGDLNNIEVNTTDSAVPSADAKKLLSEKDKEIEELKKQLAAKQATPVVDSDDEPAKDADKEEDPALEEAKALYFKALGKQVPVNKKNDLDWINEKIQEASK